MNNSKKFDESPFKHKLDTENFLAFSDVQSPKDFCPANSSSPQKPWNPQSRNYYQNNWNRRSSGNFRQYNSAQSYYNKSYNSFEYKQQQKPYFKNNRSFNSSFNRSKSESFGSGKGFDDYSNSCYLHPSFMENPWAALEKQLEEEDSKESEDLVCNITDQLEQET
ncbi:hypothetical protein FQR65_LT12943 [Abscondita terminalis]|nr:hypothetical protein FQR65_LT12943 [Abscondita terminalis]